MAHTLFADTAATPLSSLLPVPGLGLDTTVHALPFQCSTSVLALLYDPTAHTSPVDTAATPLAASLIPPLGLDTTRHALPSHCSTSVRSAPPLLSDPTAHTSVADTTPTA